MSKKYNTTGDSSGENDRPDCGSCSVNPTLIRRSMHYWRIEPDRRLQPAIQCYALVSPTRLGASRSRPADFEDQLLLPDGYSEIVFVLEGRFERRAVGQAGPWNVMASSYVIGGRSNSVIARNLTPVRLVSVKLDSRRLREIIGTPLDEFRDGTVTLRDLGCKELLRLEDAVANASSVSGIASVLDTFLLRTRWSDARTPDVAELLRGVQSSHGALSIMQFLRARHLDARTIERHFAACMGMTPKQYARIVRFKRSYGRLMLSGPDRTRVGAHLEGYYDQSHFDRDFKRFLGVSPREKVHGRASWVTTVSDHLLEHDLAEAEHLR